LRRFGEEIRQARRHHGLSQQSVATACGLDQAQVSRIERALNWRPDPGVLYCLALCVGLDAVLRTYAGGDPLRDAGHLRLLERLRRRLHPELRWRTEIPLPIPGDRRSWDAGIYGNGWWRPVEAETVVDDDQALQRKLRLKRRDGNIDDLILLVAETTRNRTALASAGGLLGDLPLCSREILAALRAGDPPPSGIVLL
jgi:transcriptional regulator with XRE-family HTH domain